jgi:tetratricopeptide (TPR) repeat protein
MTNSAQQLIYKAALILDDNGDTEAAEATLREAINLSEIAGRPVEHIQATIFLGELLMACERSEEALLLFEEALALNRNFTGDPDLVKNEIETANDYLRKAQDEKSEHSPTPLD